MPLNVMYLDDEADLCEMFEEMLLKTEIKAKAFTDPAKFLEAMKSASPDVIFLDYRLPNTNGDIIASMLDERIPKVLVTGDLHVKLESRFERVIKKPYRKQQLIDLITELAANTAGPIGR